MEKELKCSLIKTLITAEMRKFVFKNWTETSLELELNKLVEKYLRFEIHVYAVGFEDGVLYFKTMLFVDEKEVHVSWTVKNTSEISVT